jgi:transposase
LGRSRGGFSTKFHLLCDGHGHPLHFHLTAGQAHDNTALVPLLDGADESVVDGQGEPVAWPVALAGDKGYRAAWIDELLLELGITPVIPSKEMRTALLGWSSSTARPTGGGASWNA